MQAGTVAPQQAVGNGCVYPASGARRSPTSSTAKGLTWRGYMEDMGTPCRHPAANAPDDTQKAKVGDQYAARHNPFVYFHSITDRAAVRGQRRRPVASCRPTWPRPRRRRNLTYITPNLCNDAHDSPCVDGRPGGLVTADAWLQDLGPEDPGLARPSSRTACSSSPSTRPTPARSDGADACCGEGPGPNSPLPGIYGPGGGRTGTVLVSPFLKAGTINNTGYNHYSLLRTIEDIFGLAPLGYAADRPRLRLRRLGSRPMTPPPDLTRRGLPRPAAAGVAGALAVGSRTRAPPRRPPAGCPPPARPASTTSSW